MEPILFTVFVSFVIGFSVTAVISMKMRVSSLRRLLLTLAIASAVTLSAGWVEFTVSPSKNNDTWYASRSLLFNAVNPVAEMIDNKMVPGVISELKYHARDREYYATTLKGRMKAAAINVYAGKVFYYVAAFFIVLYGIALTLFFRRKAVDSIRV